MRDSSHIRHPMLRQQWEDLEKEIEECERKQRFYMKWATVFLVLAGLCHIAAFVISIIART